MLTQLVGTLGRIVTVRSVQCNPDRWLPCLYFLWGIVMIIISHFCCEAKKKRLPRLETRGQEWSLCNTLKYLCIISFQFKFDLFEKTKRLLLRCSAVDTESFHSAYGPSSWTSKCFINKNLLDQGLSLLQGLNMQPYRKTNRSSRCSFLKPFLVFTLISKTACWSN